MLTGRGGPPCLLTSRAAFISAASCAAAALAFPPPGPSLLIWLRLASPEQPSRPYLPLPPAPVGEAPAPRVPGAPPGRSSLHCINHPGATRGASNSPGESRLLLQIYGGRWGSPHVPTDTHTHHTPSLTWPGHACHTLTVLHSHCTATHPHLNHTLLLYRATHNTHNDSHIQGHLGGIHQ